MGTESFDVVLLGCKEGVSNKEVITNISKLFKASEDKITQLVIRKPVVVKKSIDYQSALKYKNALDKAGAAIRINKTTGQGSGGGYSDTMACPKCGHEQKTAVECSKCGIIVSKYQPADEYTPQPVDENTASGQDEPNPYLKVPFISVSLTSLLYPLKGDNYLTILAGVLFFWLLGMVPIIGGITSIIFLFMIKAYMLVIIETSARGDDALPEFPDIGELIRPFIFVLLIQLLCFAPVVLYLFTFPAAKIGTLLITVDPGSMATGAEVFRIIFTDPFFWLLLIFGIVSMPMALLNVALYNNILRANPVTVFASIFRIPADYFAACLLITLVYVFAFLLKYVLFSKIPILGGLLVYFATFYFMAVQMRIIGLLYATNSSRLGWFD